MFGAFSRVGYWAVWGPWWGLSKSYLRLSPICFVNYLRLSPVCFVNKSEFIIADFKGCFFNVIFQHWFKPRQQLTVMCDNFFSSKFVLRNLNKQIINAFGIFDVILLLQVVKNSQVEYRIWSSERPGLSFNFGILWGGANSNKALFREGALMKYFSENVDTVFFWQE